MADLRERLKVLDRASVPDQWHDIEERSPGHTPPLEPNPWRRIAAAAVAVTVAVAGTVLAVGTLTPERDPGTSLDPSSWPVHELRQLGLIFRSPPSWHVQPFDEQVGFARFRGALVANVEHTFKHPEGDSATTAWSFGGLPDDAVAISIERIVAGLFHPSESQRTDLPLDLSEARRLGLGHGWEELALPFVLGRSEADYVRVRFGPEASEQDREIARLVVASIEPIEPIETFDGWLVDVATDFSSAGGPLEIEVGRIRDVPENDAHPWIQHTVVLRNLGDVPLHFDDTRIGKLLGQPDPELFAGDQGCGYADPGPGRPLEWGVCLSYLDAFTIPPYGVERRTITLWKDLRGLEPLHLGRYVFAKVYRFRIGDGGGQREVDLRLTYRIDRA